MYCFQICNKIKLIYFLKFIDYKINSKIIKSGMVVLTEREKSADTNIIIGWILQSTTVALIEIG
jgi:hypothetical protein